MKVICISGSVGSGKTTLAKKLMEKLDYPVLDVKKLIKEKRLAGYYDKRRRCDVVDTKTLNEDIIKEIKKAKENKPEGIIIESHLSHYLPKRYVDLCIITKCDIEELNKRLKKRRYAKDKIKENIECEIFDICLDEAREKRHNILVINTTKALNMAKISKALR